MSSQLAPLLAAAKTAVELSEAAAEAAQRASPAAAMATIQTKAALATVKLVIDLETQKVKEPLSKDTKNVLTSTDDLAWVETASEATERVVLEVSDSDERTGRHGDYIRYPRDLLLFLQHHPISRRFPAGIADSEIVHQNLNRKAFHAKMPNARCVKMPNSAVKSFNQVCGPTNLDTNRMLDINLSHIRQGENKPNPGCPPFDTGV